MIFRSLGKRGVRVAVFALFACLHASQSIAGAGPASHAPIGVMGDHTHEVGEVMLSYRFMRMGMNGLRDDDERISRGAVVDPAGFGYLVTPTRMEMDMHMFGGMVSPIDGLTLMLMVPFVTFEMDHRTRMGGTFRTKSDGVGDVRASALIDLWESKGHRVHANLGLSFPTGSISEVARNPMSGGTKVRLPYPMQIGSGSYDLLPGLTYNGHREALSWGAQVRGEVRLNKNHANYRLGNEYALTAWGSYTLTDQISLSLRSEWQHQLNHRGQDASLVGPSAVVPTADKGRRAFMRLDVLAGINFIMHEGPLEGVRLALEAGVPAYQRLDGPGLETDWLLTAGVQYAFDAF